MAFNISIKSDSAVLERKLRTLVNKQIAFAAATATTKVAQASRDDFVLPEYRQTFEARNKAFEKVVHSVAAADIKHSKATGRAVAAIMPRDGKRPSGTTRGRAVGKVNTEFMDRHVKGGIKTPKRDRTLAVPLSTAPITRRKAGRSQGAINKAWLPETVVNKSKGFIGTSRRTGKKYIAQRTGRGGKKVQVLYTLQPSVMIKRRYSPLQAARRGVKQRFDRIFQKEFANAMRTARLR